ncbi:hypothetical protein CPC08DRAFT_257606 [Agrocybe pediades]|nr:hypothetical protein CPC08DRAFT_257606 [Agrocybe pediades]
MYYARRNFSTYSGSCFQRHTQLGTAVAIGELRGAVSEVSTTTRQLFALQISDENVREFMGSTRAVLSTLPPGVMLSEDLVFKLYIRSHIGKIDDILKNLASKQSCALERPNNRHTRPLTICSPLPPQTPGAIEYVRGSTITELVRLQQVLLNAEEGVISKQEVAWVLTSLAVDLYRLRMHSESLILCTWSVDLYRTLSISDRNAYAPRLVLALFNLALMSYRTGDFAQANATRTECLSVLKTCAPPFATETLTARALSESAYFRRAIGEHSSASLQDTEASVAMWERLGADQMVVIGPQQGGNHAMFGLQLTGGDRAVHDYAYALDAQRVFLYDSKRGCGGKGPSTLPGPGAMLQTH